MDEASEDDSVSRIAAQKPLRMLAFSDVRLRIDVLPHNPDDALYKEPGQGFRQARMKVIPEAFDDEVDLLVRKLSSLEKAAGAFSHDNVHYRYQKMVAVRDETWVNVRRFMARTMDIDKLNIAPAAVESLKTWNRTTGLVLVGGSTANGKSTTIAHMLKHYLAASGGFAITIEDPPEFPLHGMHGDYGHCLQTEVRRGDWAERFEDCLRMSPDYIMLGEIRTPETALLAVQAAATGHLVMATVHADGIDDVVSRVCNLASSAYRAGSGEYVRIELAQCLVGIVHQKLSPDGPDLTLLHPRTREAKLKVAQMIEGRMEAALQTGGWAEIHRAPRRFAQSTGMEKQS